MMEEVKARRAGRSAYFRGGPRWASTYPWRAAELGALGSVSESFKVIQIVVKVCSSNNMILVLFTVQLNLFPVLNRF